MARVKSHLGGWGELFAVVSTVESSQSENSCESVYVLLLLFTFRSFFGRECNAHFPGVISTHNKSIRVL